MGEGSAWRLDFEGSAVFVLGHHANLQSPCARKRQLQENLGLLQVRKGPFAEWAGKMEGSDAGSSGLRMNDLGMRALHEQT